nr:MAG TPA: transmembrane protein [Caudoviricetes sp.]
MILKLGIFLVTVGIIKLCVSLVMKLRQKRREKNDT